MKSVFMFFSLMFCFFLGLQTSSAQSYVNAEEASIRMKKEIVLMNVTNDIDAVDYGPNPNSTLLRYKFYYGVLRGLPQDKSLFNAVIDEQFNILTQNGIAKNKAVVSGIRSELKELLRI